MKMKANTITLISVLVALITVSAGQNNIVRSWFKLSPGVLCSADQQCIIACNNQPSVSCMSSMCHCELNTPSTSMFLTMLAEYAVCTLDESTPNPFIVCALD